MKILERHSTLLSILILAAISLVAVIYGIATFRSQPTSSSFSPVSSYVFPYDLSEPSQTFSLPAELEEISGLAHYQGSDILAVQDELGILYQFNLDQQKIIRKIEFGKDRDYEGVAFNDGHAYILERDGDLHVVNDFSADVVASDKFETEFSYRNNTEGICYDPVSGRLLITPKERGLEAANRTENRRGVYAFDLSENRLLPDPVYYVDEEDLGEVIYERAERRLMKPSAIAVEPQTGHIFVLSSVGQVLVVLDRQSHILHVEILRRNDFKQPEGIAFTAEGDLLISNEGQGSGANLLRFIRQSDVTTDPQNTAE